MNVINYEIICGSVLCPSNLMVFREFLWVFAVTLFMLPEQGKAWGAFGVQRVCTMTVIDDTSYGTVFYMLTNTFLNIL